jgi:uncharacterized protein (TIGR03435 family)
MPTFRSAALAPLAVVFAAVASCQTGSDAAPAFQVASVKASPPASREHPASAIDPSLFSIKNTSLKRFVMMAYGISGSQAYRVAGGPAWADADPYDIEAHPDGPASRQEMYLMLRSLLADRFQLKVHRETRPLLMNVVLAAKGGPKFGPGFHEMKEGDPPVNPGASTMKRMTFPGVPFQTFVDRLGLWMTMDPVTHLRAEDVLPVYDGTGLAGRYVIVFNADPQEDWSAALEHQLGLKLEQRKVPTELIVIDSAAKPSAN